MIGGTRYAQAQRLMSDLIVPDRFCVWMQEDMRMSFDESRQQREPRQVYHLGIEGRFDTICWSCFFNAFAAYKHHPIVVKLGRLAIENVRGLEEINCLGLSDWGLCACLID